MFLQSVIEFCGTILIIGSSLILQELANRKTKPKNKPIFPKTFQNQSMYIR